MLRNSSSRDFASSAVSVLGFARTHLGGFDGSEAPFSSRPPAADPGLPGESCAPRHADENAPEGLDGCEGRSERGTEAENAPLGIAPHLASGVGGGAVPRPILP